MKLPIKMNMNSIEKWLKTCSEHILIKDGYIESMSFLLRIGNPVIAVIDPKIHKLSSDEVFKFIKDQSKLIYPDYIACVRTDKDMEFKGPYIHIESIDGYYISMGILNSNNDKIIEWHDVFNGTKKEFMKKTKSTTVEFILDDPLISQIIKKTIGNIPLSDNDLDLPLSFYDEVKPIKTKIEYIDM